MLDFNGDSCTPLDFATDELLKSKYTFSDSDLIRIKESVRDLYNIFHRVMSSPRKWDRSKGSLYNFKFKRLDVRNNPDCYYSFSSFDIHCFIGRRAGSKFSIFSNSSVSLSSALPSLDFDYKTGKARFSGGYFYIGDYGYDDFQVAVKDFYTVVSWICLNRKDYFDV